MLRIIGTLILCVGFLFFSLAYYSLTGCLNIIQFGIWPLIFACLCWSDNENFQVLFGGILGPSIAQGVSNDIVYSSCF